MKTLIKNGLVYDGSTNPPSRKNILVEGDKITAVTQSDRMEADRVLDGDGMVVTPGFIDTHRHCDLAALYDREFGKLELAQGLTAVVGGNCGLGFVPASEEYGREMYDFIEPCLGKLPSVPAPVSLSQYYESLSRVKKPLHIGSFLGTGAVKAAVKGYGRGRFTRKEMETAKSYIREGLSAGAMGLSMGIMYQPECYSSREEMVELLSAAAPFGRHLTCHIRGEGDNLVSSVLEVIEMAKEAGLSLNISHFKATGVTNWGKTIHKAIEEIEKARACGQDVTVDFYPYCGGSTTLVSLLPPSLMENTMEETLRKLSTPAGKKKCTEEIYKAHPGWDNMVTAIGWERIRISSVSKEENKGFSGKSFQEAARMAGYGEPVEFLCDLLVQEEGKVGIIVLSMSQEDVDRVARLPYSMVISDALYGPGDCPHPRLYGSFPKIIRDYVLKRKVLPMEEAVHKMTALPAKRLGLFDRGRILEGYQADLLVFQPDKLKDHSSYENPRQLCTGLAAVLVDGSIVLEQDNIKIGNCGTVLKK